MFIYIACERGLAVPEANEHEILKYNDGVYSLEKDLLVEERRVEIYVGGRPYVSVMATPAQLECLAVGYLFTEGVIAKISDVKSISVHGLRVLAEVRGNPPAAPARARSCGFGLGSVTLKGLQLEDINIPESPPPLITAERIVRLMEEFNQLSKLFWKTGAVHSAWLLRGEHRFFAEDVGRHNALDKVIGRYLSEAHFSGRGGLMFATGRISTEMLLKTARAGLSALISRGSVSSLAVELAEKLNIILIGFSRGDQFTAFTGGEHICQAQEGGGHLRSEKQGERQ